MERINKNLGFSGCLAVSAIGRSGGLALLCRKEEMWRFLIILSGLYRFGYKKIFKDPNGSLHGFMENWRPARGT